MLQHVDAIGKGVGGIVGANFAMRLEDDFATIYLLIHIVNGDTTLAIAGSEYGLVNVVTIHARTAMAGQE